MRFVALILFVAISSARLFSRAAENNAPSLRVVTLIGKITVGSGRDERVYLRPERNAVIPLGQTIRVINGGVVLERGAVAMKADAGAVFLCAPDGDDAFTVRVEDRTKPVELEAGGYVIAVPPGGAVRVKNPIKGPVDVVVIKGTVAAQGEDGRVTFHDAGQRVASARGAEGPGGPRARPALAPEVRPGDGELVISPSTPRN